MKDNLFTKVALFIGVILLFLNLIGFVYSPSSSYAAKSIQYKVKDIKFQYDTGKLIQAELDKSGSEGWELVAIDTSGGHMIYKK